MADRPEDAAELRVEGEEGEGPPSAGEALAWKGWRLDELGGLRSGKVEQVYVDAESGEGAWVLARIGRFGSHSPVPFADAVAIAGRVWVPYDSDLVRSAPKLRPGAELTREAELELCSHFGIPDGVGRTAAVAARPSGAVTARPAEG